MNQIKLRVNAPELTDICKIIDRLQVSYKEQFGVPHKHLGHLDELNTHHAKVGTPHVLTPSTVEAWLRTITSLEPRYKQVLLPSLFDGCVYIPDAPAFASFLSALKELLVLAYKEGKELSITLE